MSQAFIAQWNRTSAAKRLLVMLTAIAKQRHNQGETPLTFDLDALEAVAAGEGVVQAIEDDKVVLRFVTEDAKLYIVESAQAVEREPRRQPWPQTEDDLPTRLRELVGERAQPKQPLVTTVDDGEMATREAQMHRSAIQREAASRRNQPLPITQPPMQQ